MDADGVEVLHVADGDAVAGGVAHDLVLDLLPASDALFDQALADAGEAQAVGAHRLQLLAGAADAAARAAQRVGGAHNDGVADLFGEHAGVLDSLDDQAVDAGLADGLHGLLEREAVLRLLDGGRLRADDLDAHFVQIAFFGKLHDEV